MDLSGYGVIGPHTTYKLKLFLLDIYSRQLDLKTLTNEFLKFAVSLTEAEAGIAFLYGTHDDNNNNNHGSQQRNLVVSTAGEPRFMNNPSLSAELKEIVQSRIPRPSSVTHPESRLTIPVLTDEDVTGALILESSKGQHFSDECRGLLQELASEVSCLRKRIIFSEWAKSRGYDLYLVGRSNAIRKVEELVEKISVADCPVLIQGESGTGKELIALLLHFYSRRRNKPYVVINCGAFTSDTLLSSELFGHVRGAFTDARSDKRGKFEIAHGGTIFLDEVSCMSPKMQIALLRTLRAGEVQKIGDDELRRKVDVRIVSASNQDLGELIKDSSFREDVYYRLRVAEIRLPPLRERKGDIQFLTRYYLEHYSQRDGLPRKRISDPAMRALLAYDWPDNIAGLENAVRSALLLSDDKIDVKDLPEHLRAFENESKPKGNGKPLLMLDPSSPSVEGLTPLLEELNKYQKNYIREALLIHAWNVSRTAKALGITRQGLQKKIRTYGLRNPELEAAVNERWQ